MQLIRQFELKSEEMYKMAAIEKLIGAEINKLTIPPHIGVSPEWNPCRPKGGFQRGGRRPEGKTSSGQRPKSSNAGGQHKKHKPIKKGE